MPDKRSLSCATALMRDWVARSGGRPLLVSGEMWTALARAGCDMSLLQTQERAMLGLGSLDNWCELTLTGDMP